VAIARVTDSSGTQELEVRKDKDKNYYARSSVVEGIHKIFSDIGDGLDKGLDDFRNKKLFDFGWSEPSRIEVRREGKTVVYQKVGDKWMSGDQAMDSPSVQALIDKLRDLSAVKFPEKGGGAPVLEITVTSNEGKRVEKVILSRQGNSWFATREKEPAVYELEASAVEQLEKALGEVKPAPASQKQGGTQGKK
jgi:hypothetical protein